MPKGSGRRPLPTAVKKLRGNPGKRPLNKAEPKPKSLEPPMPKGLPAVAIAEWRSIVPELLNIGVLSTIDGKALAAYCHCFARWREAAEEVDRLGIIVEEPIVGGTDREVVGYKYKRNPAIIIENDALKLMGKFLCEFGLTPASRGRIRIEKPPEDDPFESFLKSKAKVPASEPVN